MGCSLLFFCSQRISFHSEHSECEKTKAKTRVYFGNHSTVHLKKSLIFLCKRSLRGLRGWSYSNPETSWKILSVSRLLTEYYSISGRKNLNNHLFVPRLKSLWSPSKKSSAWSTGGEWRKGKGAQENKEEGGNGALINHH